MPQGGIDKRETPIDAAFRELEEETSVTSASFVGEVPGWLTYDLPEDLLGIALKGKYRGQKQRWFAMRFTGKEREINIQPRRGHKAEFDQWRWEDLDRLPGLIVPFKRKIYENVVTAFEPAGGAAQLNFRPAVWLAISQPRPLLPPPRRAFRSCGFGMSQIAATKA